jgi:hypothetical protein
MTGDSFYLPEAADNPGRVKRKPARGVAEVDEA